MTNDLRALGERLLQFGRSGRMVVDHAATLPVDERRAYLVRAFKHFRGWINAGFKWLQLPVDPQTFVEHGYFLNQRNEIYPEVMLAIIELNSGEYVEAVMTGGIGSGKTSLAILSTVYQLYVLSCIDNPHEALGQQASSEILFVIQSITSKLAKGVDYLRMRTMIENSKYFANEFAPDPNRTDEMHFPRRIMIKPLSGDPNAAIGQNCLGCIIDEVNWMEIIANSSRAGDGGEFDQATIMYNTIQRRRKSRFMLKGRMPGLICLVSSKRYPGEFTDRKMAEARKEVAETGKTSIYVYDKKIWEIKPKGSYTEGMFDLFLGDTSRKPRIIEDGEEVSDTERPLIMQIPRECRIDFERDILSAIRDIAGMATLALHPFILDVETAVAAFGRAESVLSNDVCDFQATTVTIHKSRFWNPKEPRYAHLDLALTGDSAGVAVGCVRRFLELDRNGSKEMLPEINLDLLLEVRPPKNGEINFAKIRTLLYKLREQGLNIKWVSADSFQCVAGDTRILAARGMIPAAEIQEGDLVQSRIGPRKVLKKWSFGPQRCLKITSTDGHSVTVTEPHKLEVGVGWKYDGKGKRRPVWGWVKAEDLKIGDILHAWDEESTLPLGEYAPLKGPSFSPNSIFHIFPKTLTPKLAEAVGLLWGDGYIRKDGISLTCALDEAEDAASILTKAFGCAFSTRYYQDRKCAVIEVSSRSTASWLALNGLVKNDKIPEIIWRSPRDVQAAFLRGLFSTDGSVSTEDGGSYYSTKHKEWAVFVQDTLRMNWGLSSCIVSSARIEGQCYATKTTIQYIVCVRGSRKAFYDAVNYCYITKSNKLASHLHRPGRQLYTKIRTIEVTEAEVYDFEVEEDHAYIANGLVSHNSRDSLQILNGQGFATGLLSMDVDSKPYDVLKSALYDRRILAPKSSRCQTEIVRLERDPKTGKIDHPSGNGGSKDVADALCGVVYGLTMQRQIWAQHNVPLSRAPLSLTTAITKQKDLSTKLEEAKSY